MAKNTIFWNFSKSRRHTLTGIFQLFAKNRFLCASADFKTIWAKKLFFNFWRFSRLWLILEASRYIHWAFRCSWWFSIGRITSVPCHFVIALLVWPQWHAKVRAYRWKRKFWNVVPFLGVAHTCNFTNFNFWTIPLHIPHDWLWLPSLTTYVFLWAFTISVAKSNFKLCNF